MFTNEDEIGMSYSYDDALVVMLGVGPYEVSKILIDTRSSGDIIFKNTLDSIKIEDLRLSLVDTALNGFAKSYILSIGTVQLPVTIGSQPYQKATVVTFQVVELKNVVYDDLGKIIPTANEGSIEYTLPKAEI